MAGAFSDYLENQIVRHWFRNTTMASPPATVYVALFTSAPSDSGGGTEVSTSSTGYGRQGVTTGTSGTGAGSGWTDTNGTNGQTSNVSDITYSTALLDWGTITSFALFDASTSGNMLFYGNLTSNKTVTTGDIFKFSAGNLAITVD